MAVVTVIIMMEGEESMWTKNCNKVLIATMWVHTEARNRRLGVLGEGVAVAMWVEGSVGKGAMYYGK